VSQTPTGALQYAHINTLTTTVVKSAPGMLHTVTINSKGGTASIATIYDNTSGSGTVLAVIDVTAQLVTLVYDIQFLTGLTIVTATGSAADLTVSYT